LERRIGKGRLEWKRLERKDWKGNDGKGWIRKEALKK